MKRVKAKTAVDTPVTEEVLAKAIERGRAREGAQATELFYDRLKKALRFRFADNVELGLPVARFEVFSGLSDEELSHVRLTPSGTVVELEERDLHVSIPGLLAGTEAVGKLAATIAAIRAGRVSSVAKAAAAQTNGRKGGRRPTM